TRLELSVRRRVAGDGTILLVGWPSDRSQRIRGVDHTRLSVDCRRRVRGHVGVSRRVVVLLDRPVVRQRGGLGLSHSGAVPGCPTSVVVLSSGCAIYSPPSPPVGGGADDAAVDPAQWSHATTPEPCDAP